MHRVRQQIPATTCQLLLPLVLGRLSISVHTAAKKGNPKFVAGPHPVVAPVGGAPNRPTLPAVDYSVLRATAGLIIEARLAGTAAASNAARVGTITAMARPAHGHAKSRFASPKVLELTIT